ncbi:Uma2 family endonuclease [Thiothrix subterranea]|uniref:Uma2 family endonuclease n=1 Tax=Thiothrix subterranea TaxID=2735563 RepID=UPI00192B0DF0|nr:Uma2 family endonuclease [Thiothrix subterranea]QQZ28382.1 Uma2 family endonuclease [Thiothrix subterranea]
MLLNKITPDHPAYISEQAYWEGEKRAEIRHEYVKGKVFAMPGNSRRHNRIVLNVALALDLAGKSIGCPVNMLTVKVRVQGADAYYYPNVMVGCERDDAHAYYLEKPCLLVEVDSKATAWKNFTEKVIAYQKLASLQVYLIVAQDQPLVTMFYRDAETGWEVARFDDLEQALTLPCPNCTLTLADIYEGIDFTQPAE